MHLLFKREQTLSPFGGVRFKLWAKTQFDEDEEHMVRRYRFDGAKLIESFQPHLFRHTVIVAIAVVTLTFALAVRNFGPQLAAVVAISVGIVGGYLFYDNRRESVMVRDLIYGRHFSCDSVVELARKEAWLETVVAFLRQVMESAKHWDGTETVEIEALSKQQAKFVILKGL